MKKLISVVLCMIIFASIFSVSAYADSHFILHKKNTEGVLITSGVWANSPTDGNAFYYPENSTFKLLEDLYSDDTSVQVSIFSSKTGWSLPKEVSVDILYFFPDHVRIIGEAA